MPYFGLTSIFLSSFFYKSVRLTPVLVCDMLRLRCAAYSGLTVRLAPAYALNYKQAILGGLFMGIAILTIPTFLFVLVFLLLFSCIWRRKILYPTILLVGIAGLTLIPWMVRNYYIFQEFGLTTNFGDNFIIGNNPCTTPNNGPLAYKCLDEVYHKASLLNLNEFDKSNYLTNQAMAYWKTDPLHYIHLYILKTLNYFNYRNDLATQSEASLGKDILMLISYGLLAIIGFVRLFYYKFIPITDFEKFHYLLYLLSSFVLALLFTRIRYRLPFDYCLIIIGGNFLGHLLEGWQSKSQEALV